MIKRTSTLISTSLQAQLRKDRTMIPALILALKLPSLAIESCLNRSYNRESNQPKDFCASYGEHDQLKSAMEKATRMNFVIELHNVRGYIYTRMRLFNGKSQIYQLEITIRFDGQICSVASAILMH